MVQPYIRFCPGLVQFYSMQLSKCREEADKTYVKHMAPAKRVNICTCENVALFFMSSCDLNSAFFVIKLIRITHYFVLIMASNKFIDVWNTGD